MTYIQWTTSDDTNFFPVGKTVDDLPPGCYTVQESMQGMYLQKQELRTNKLLKLPDTNSDKVVSEISKFWDSKEKFAEHKMPYKRGMLLYGPPGSGKTSAVRTAMNDVMERGGCALEFKYPSTFMEGYKMIRQVHPERPIVAVMEDVDAILERCSESDFLNVLDGVHDLNNVVFVATTNYPERLGSRIFNRPSRFDKRFKIGMPTAESRKMYLEHKGITEGIEQWVKDTAGLSIAHLAELYTAVQVFGESYDVAVSVIKGMETIPHSSMFDKSGIEHDEERVGRAYYEHKKKMSGGKVLSESKSGKKLMTEGKPAKKTTKRKQVTMEDLLPKNAKDGNGDIDQIADML